MHAVVRRYSGQGASNLFDELEKNKGDVESIISGVTGLVSYSLFRTDDGGVSVTVCQDKAGTDESVRLAAEWIKDNIDVTTDAPVISEGDTIIQLTG